MFRVSVITSDWLFLSMLSCSSVLSLGIQRRLEFVKVVSLLLWYTILISYTLKGLYSYPLLHVVKNSLFFYLIPAAALLRTGGFFNARFINVLISLIVLQCLVVVFLHFLGVEVFRREDWFTKLLGFYTSGGTVVNSRFYSYNFTILMSLIFMRIALQNNVVKLLDILLLIFAIVLSGSKGIVLAAFFLCMILVWKNLKKFNWMKIIITTFVVVVFTMYFPIYQLFMAVFDTSDISNVTRLQISYYLIESKLTIWGEGFGASLPDGFIRDSTRPYGFEISYISYYHKLGIFFILLSMIMITLFGIQSLLYTLPIWLSALGNPTLTHLMNFIILYLAVCTSRTKSEHREAQKVGKK